VDVRASLLGEQGRKPALQEVQGLLDSVKTYLHEIASEHPRYADAIRRSTADIDMYIDNLGQGLGEANRFLAQDSLICAYLNALKKQDWLAHKPCLPQALSTLWMGDIERRQALQAGLKPLHSAVTGLDTMLHDFVDWQWRRADEGNDQILLDRDASFGLLAVGLDPSIVQMGIVPDISRNRFMVQLRFQHWRPGSSPCSATVSVPYAMMLVPVV